MYTKNNKTMELTLIKTKTFNLEPYGKFAAKWKKPRVDTPNTLYIGEITINHDSAMPLSAEQEKELIKLMKKFKTDVLTDSGDFYTITSSGLTGISHPKLWKYKNDPTFKELVDNGRSF